MIAESGRRSAPLKVLYVVRTGGGGAVISLLLLIKHLDRQRIQPVVLFYGPTPYADDFRTAGAEVRFLDSSVSVRSMAHLLPDGIVSARRERPFLRRVSQLNGFLQRDVRLARRIVHVIEEVQPDLVQGNICPSADRTSILAAGLTRVPYVAYMQFWTRGEPWLDRPLSMFVERYLCVSEAVRRQLLNDVHVPVEKTEVVYTPFEFPSTVSSLDDRVRRALGVRNGGALVANIGRVVPWKGQDIFLRAFASISRDHPDATAVIVGSAGGSTAGRAFEAELRRLAVELGLADRVIFTGHRSDVEDLMRASNVVVHSSSKPEPLGRVIMEAIAVGTPVIATEAGGVPEMIRDGETGLLVPPGDVEAMASALDTLLSDPTQGVAMAKRARSTTGAKFSAASFVQRMESEYRRIATP